MKFYTKQWYELMQNLDYCICMKPIEDKDYNDTEIAALYDKCLKKEIARAQKEYDAPPEFIPVDYDDADLDDFAVFDTEKQVLRKPESIEQLKQLLEAEKERAQKEYEARPPFDAAEIEEEFEHGYNIRLEHEFERFPQEEIVGVDRRLIALGFLPKSVYDRLKALSKANKREFDKIERAARKALYSSENAIPEDVAAAFGRLHDAAVLSVRESDGDIVMMFALDEIPFDDGSCEDGGARSARLCITFENARILEREEDAIGKDAYYLYDELYKTDGGYEVHMMYGSDGLKYLTLGCTDITVAEVDGNLRGS